MATWREAVRKARKGVIRVKLLIDEEGRVKDASVTGDFFMYPEDALWKLERALKGASVEELAARVRDALKEVKLVGSTVDDFVKAVSAAAEAGSGS